MFNEFGASCVQLRTGASGLAPEPAGSLPNYRVSRDNA